MKENVTTSIIRATGKIIVQTILDDEGMVDSVIKANKLGERKFLRVVKISFKKLSKGKHAATSDTDEKDTAN